MAAEAAAAALDGSFSSDSDDEFLTVRDDGKKSLDREALIRKKLLENFYGKSDDPDNHILPSGSTDDDDDDDSDDDYRKHGRSGRAGEGDSEDLDSPHFSALAHTRRHVLGSNVHQLLDIEEGLACQVRSLDSSMQTLVYENYSRFIDGTDAIRSIGVNVEANEDGLNRLSSSMHTISRTSKDIEDTLGELRDNVVEKLRVKRLLQRLDTLLKLPKTLNGYIRAGKYRLAAKSYIQAYSILSKHSTGFESLQRIETECEMILNKMVAELKHKLLHWSGRHHLQGGDGGGYSHDNDDYDNDNNSRDDDDDDEEDLDAVIELNDGANAGGGAKRGGEAAGETEELPMPNPPNSIAEIFECAGTPILLSQFGGNTAGNPQSAGSQDGDGRAQATQKARVVVDLTMEECKEMALAASLRQFERILDTHHIELQEARMGGAMSMDFADPTANVPQLAEPTNNDDRSPESLIPTIVLDSILEATSLFASNFAVDRVTSDHDTQCLSDFVSEAFGSFLYHCRGELLDRTVMSKAGSAAFHELEAYGETKPTSSTDDDDAKLEEEDERAYEDILMALNSLLAAVRQLSSGLQSSQIEFDEDLTTSLVDQTVGLTETMVRRRVDQKFYALRLRVVKDCFAPFCDRASEEEKTETPSPDGGQVLQLVQMASIALSDSLQLVDDTVRSILGAPSDDTETSATTTTDTSMLKPAVEASTRKFASWLASAIEILAGCESGHANTMLEVKFEALENNDQPDMNDILQLTTHINTARDDVSEYSAEGQMEAIDLVDDALYDLVGKLDASSKRNVRLDVTLALAEMSRVAERSVVDNIEQCIATHSGTGKQRKTKGMFPNDAIQDDAQATSESSPSNPMALRFRLAASRALGIYATSLGYEASSLLCSDIPQLTSDEAPDPVGPTISAVDMLALVKQASVDCADLFGGPKSAAPMPDELEDQFSLPGVGGTRSGLVFDVERMLTEKVEIYPHPQEIAHFTKNSIVATIFKVAFKNVAEILRFHQLSAAGYRQLLVNCEFMKFLLVHFVKDEFMTEGYNAPAVLERLVSDTCAVGLDTCKEREYFLDEDSDVLVNEARSAVRAFMTEEGGDAGKVSTFAIPKEE